MEPDIEANHFCRLCQELFNESAPWQGQELSSDQSVQETQLQRRNRYWTRTARCRRGLLPVNLITSEILEQWTLEDLNKVFSGLRYIEIFTYLATSNSM